MLILRFSLFFPLIRICLDSKVTVYTHTYTLIVTLHYACCYDEIKGTQDLKLVLMLVL